MAQLAEIVAPERHSPPDVPVSLIRDHYVWLIAALPIIWRFVESKFYNIPNLEDTHIEYGLKLVTYVLLAYCDLRIVNKASRKRISSGTLFYSLIPPIYLFARARALGRTYILIFVWIVVFFTSNSFDEFIFADGMAYGVGIPPCGSALIAYSFEKFFNHAHFSDKLFVVSAYITDSKEDAVTSNSMVCSATIHTSLGDTVAARMSIISKDRDFFFRVDQSSFSAD